MENDWKKTVKFKSGNTVYIVNIEMIEYFYFSQIIKSLINNIV